MPEPNSETRLLIDKLCASEQFVAFRDEVAEHFQDEEFKDERLPQIKESLRERVKNQAPNINSERQDDIVSSLMTKLMEEARAATDVAPSDAVASGPDGTSPEERLKDLTVDRNHEDWLSLARKFRDDLPQPVAWSLVRFAKRFRSGDGLMRWKMFLDLFEITTRTLASIVVGAYVHRGCPDAEANQQLLRHLAKKVSLGDWWQSLMHTVRSCEEIRENHFVDTVANKLLDGRDKPNAIAKACESVIEARNKHLAHNVTMPDSEYSPLLTEHSPAVIELLELLSGLEEAVMLSVAEAEDNTVTYGVPLMGPSTNTLEEPMDFSVPVEDIAPGDVLFYDKGNEQCWRVFPMQFFEENVLEDEANVFMLDSARLQNGNFNGVSYLGIPSREKRQIREEDQSFERATKILEQLVSSESTETHPRNASRSANYRSPGLEEIIQKHRKHFLGRTDLIDEFLSDPSEGPVEGIRLVAAPPGRGKTAFAAEIAGRTDAVAHFFSRSSGRTSSLGALRSISSQLAERLDRSLHTLQNFSEAVPTYQSLLFDAAAKRAEQGKSLHLVIDAMDEAEFSGRDGEKTLFLPDPLPDNLVVLATSREDELLTEWRSRRDTTELDLPPLSISEVRELAHRRDHDIDPETLNRLFQFCRGNPLLLNLGLDALAEDGHTADDDWLQADEDPAVAVYEAWMRRLEENRDSDAYEIFALLYAARRGLSFHELRELGSYNRKDLRRQMKAARNILEFDRGYFHLFHQSFRDFLESDSEYALGRAEIQRAHNIIADGCRQDILGRGYRRFYLPYHLFELNKWSSIEELAQEPNYVDGIAQALADGLLSSDASNQDQALKVTSSFLQAKEEKAVKAFCATVHELMDRGEYDDALLELANQMANQLSGPEQVSLHALLARADRERGHLEEADSRLSPLVGTHLDTIDPEDRVRICYTYADTRRVLGHYGDAMNWYERSQEMVDAQEEPARWLEIEYHLSDLHFVRGEISSGLDRLDDAGSFAKDIGLTLRRGQIERIKGHCWYVRGRREQTLDCYQRAHEFFSLINDPVHLAKIANNLAETLLLEWDNFFVGARDPVSRSELDEVYGWLDMAKELNTKHEQNLELGKCTLTRSLAASTSGDVDRAIELVQEASDILSTVGYYTGIALSDLHHARILLHADSNQSVSAPSLDRAKELAITAFKQLTENDSYPVYRAVALCTAIEAGLDHEEARDMRETIPYLDEIPATNDRLSQLLGE